MTDDPDTPKVGQVWRSEWEVDWVVKVVHASGAITVRRIGGRSDHDVLPREWRDWTLVEEAPA